MFFGTLFVIVKSDGGGGDAAQLLVVFFMGFVLGVGTYCNTWTLPMLRAVCGCRSREDELETSKDLSGSYFQATWNRGTSNHESVESSIKTISNDIPQIRFIVLRTENQNATISNAADDTLFFYTLPIAHFRWVGTTAAQFLSVLDDNHRGDAVVDYVPDIITLPEQSEYLAKFAEAVTKIHAGKAQYVKMGIRIVCG